LQDLPTTKKILHTTHGWIRANPAAPTRHGLIRAGTRAPMIHIHGTCMCACHTHAVQCRARIHAHGSHAQLSNQQHMDSKRPSERPNWPGHVRAGLPSCPSSLACRRARRARARVAHGHYRRKQQAERLSALAAGAQGPGPPQPWPRPRKKLKVEEARRGEEHCRDRDASQRGARGGRPPGGSGSGRSVGRCGHVTGLMVCWYA